MHSDGLPDMAFVTLNTRKRLSRRFELPLRWLVIWTRSKSTKLVYISQKRRNLDPASDPASNPGPQRSMAASKRQNLNAADIMRTLRNLQKALDAMTIDMPKIGLWSLSYVWWLGGNWRDEVTDNAIIFDRKTWKKSSMGRSASRLRYTSVLPQMGRFGWRRIGTRKEFDARLNCVLLWLLCLIVRCLLANALSYIELFLLKSKVRSDWFYKANYSRRSEMSLVMQLLY